jgi:hypothetical protein
MKKVNYIIYMFSIIFLITSCDSVKRGVTGSKKLSTDEFLIKKKDPLIIPPDYKNLPEPDEIASEDISDFEKNLGDSIEEVTSKSSSIENSILKKIKSK